MSASGALGIQAGDPGGAPTDSGPVEVSILLVNWNTRDMTLECLASIYRQTTRVSFEVIVVDNGSTDGSAPAIAAAFPQVTLLAEDVNHGFAAATNMQARLAQGEKLLLLNTDTVVLDHAIDALAEFARENPKALIWGGRTLFGDGSLNRTSCWRKMSPWSVLVAALGLTAFAPGSALFNPRGYWNGITGVEVFDGAGLANFRIVGSVLADTIDLSGTTLIGVERVDGGAGDDIIIGSIGDDRIYGGTGNDSLVGGAGNDTFLVQYDSGFDAIDGGAGLGDAILALTASTKVDWTKVTGIEAVDASGKANFQLVGTGGDDTLDFSGVTLTGVSVIDGGAGNDVIIGSAGNDTIVGGLGSDTLTGGAGSDTFRFTGLSQLSGTAQDHILDFQAEDRIDFSGIDADTHLSGTQAFSFIGGDAFTGAGQVRAYSDGEGHTVIEGNINADLAADFRLVLDSNFAVGADHFVGLAL
jgi:Ca2+-binding RTX toxin-like protein